MSILKTWPHLFTALAASCLILFSSAGFPALAGDGPNAAELRTVLESGDPAARLVAANQTAALGPAALEAAPALVPLLGDKNRELRRAAISALAAIGEKGAPLLLEPLSSKEMLVRRSALEVLGRLGEKGEGLIPGLIKLLGRRDSGLGGTACEALALIGPKSVPFLIRSLDNKGERLLAVRTLGLIGPQGAAAVDRLIRLIDDPDARVSAAAMTALGGMGKESARAAPKLIEMLAGLGYDDSRLPAAAAEALGLIGPDAAMAAPALAGIIRSPNAYGREDSKLRPKALAALARISPGSPETETLLNQALTDTDPAVRQAAIEALQAVKPGG